MLFKLKVNLFIISKISEHRQTKSPLIFLLTINASLFIGISVVLIVSTFTVPEFSLQLTSDLELRKYLVA